MNRHLVLISGGLASFEAARRVISRFGEENVKLWFFDTLIEDEDLYRFLNDIEELFGIDIQRFADGRTPWEVFKDERYIGNSRVDLCSKKLKRNLLEKQLKKEYPNKDVILYFGLEWTENHRISVLKPKWEDQGYQVDFPLTWDPLLFPNDYINIVQRFNICVPRLYDLGFLHNNCGGACIKAGIQQWSLLYKTFPDRFLWHEQQEQKLRKFLGKNIAILRSRKRGQTRPLTLRFLRWRLENSTANVSKNVVDDSSCSCFFNADNLKREGALRETET